MPSGRLQGGGLTKGKVSLMVSPPHPPPHCACVDGDKDNIPHTHVRSQTFREGGPNFVPREGDNKNLLREGEKLSHLGRE